jgi:hypothetical protein
MEFVHHIPTGEDYRQGLVQESSLGRKPEPEPDMREYVLSLVRQYLPELLQDLQQKPEPQPEPQPQPEPYWERRPYPGYLHQPTSMVRGTGGLLDGPYGGAHAVNRAEQAIVISDKAARGC